MTTKPAQLNVSRPHRVLIVTGIFITLLTLAVYGQVRNHAFIDFDDYEYITENPHVRTGLTADNIVWAFGSYHSNNWHPLTWISHMIDVELFGLNPAGHHLVNVLLHIANSLLLLALLWRMTGAVGASALTAALFALHPLHVESVAWAAERKDVLSCFFWMLTMLMYVRYVARPDWQRYLPVAAVFAAGLMAKQMLVTLPFALLLLDSWPLGRMQRPAGRLVVEKIPLFILAAIASIIVFTVQLKSGVLYNLPQFPLAVRLENALVAYVSYLGKTFWPAGLAVFYPHPLHTLPPGTVLGAAGLILAISVAVLWLGKRRPYLAVGWFWYLGTLIPVIGLVQVGVQAMADRYTYIPLIGIFIIVVWGGRDLIGWISRSATAPGAAGEAAGGNTHSKAIAASAIPRHEASAQPGQRGWKTTPEATASSSPIDISRKHRQKLKGPGREKFSKASRSPEQPKASSILLPLPGAFAIGFALALLLFLSYLTWKQAGYWRDNITLYERAIRVVPDNYWAYNNLGAALAARGQLDAAADLFAKSLAILPTYPGANRNMAVYLYKKGRYTEALPFLETALKVQPRNPELHITRGAALLKAGRNEEAAGAFQSALKFRPGDPDAAAGLHEASAGSHK